MCLVIFPEGPDFNVDSQLVPRQLRAGIGATKDGIGFVSEVSRSEHLMGKGRFGLVTIRAAMAELAARIFRPTSRCLATHDLLRPSRSKKPLSRAGCRVFQVALSQRTLYPPVVRFHFLEIPWKSVNTRA